MSAPDDHIARVRVARVGPADVLDVRWPVLRAGRPRATAVMEGDDAPDAIHLAAWRAADAAMCGVVSVLRAPEPEAADRPARWQLRGMAVLEHCQGEGIGSALLDGVERALPGAALWCNARAGAVGFYARHGWVITSDSFDVPGIGPHHRMRRPAR